MDFPSFLSLGRVLCSFVHFKEFLFLHACVSVCVSVCRVWLSMEARREPSIGILHKLLQAQIYDSLLLWFPVWQVWLGSLQLQHQLGSVSAETWGLLQARMLVSSIHLLSYRVRAYYPSCPLPVAKSYRPTIAPCHVDLLEFGNSFLQSVRRSLSL